MRAVCGDGMRAGQVAGRAEEDEPRVECRDVEGVCDSVKAVWPAAR